LAIIFDFFVKDVISAVWLYAIDAHKRKAVKIKKFMVQCRFSDSILYVVLRIVFFQLH